jgi:hypothetical protein
LRRRADRGRRSKPSHVLIQASGYTATQARAALLPLPLPLVIALASPAAGALAVKVGPRWLLITGPLIVAASFLLAVRIGHKLLARSISRDGRNCFGNGWCGRPAHDSSADVSRQPPHGCGIRAEQRSSAYWRIGCYSPYRTCDSVIRICVAFSFWCRRGDRRSHLPGSSGERFYVDRPAGKTQPSVER